MPRSDVCPDVRRARPARAGATVAGATLAGAVLAGVAGAQSLEIRPLHIESTPSAAEVELIGGPAGRTPLTISERDIYPNHYPDARADLYGAVVLRHPGCAPLQHRVTSHDVEQGLQLRLDCSDVAGEAPKTPTVALRAAPTPSPAPAPAPTTSAAPVPAAPMPHAQPAPTTAPAASAAFAPAPANPSDTVSQRRLRQLQVLQELLDEGLLSPAEEQRVRRRILEGPAGR